MNNLFDFKDPATQVFGEEGINNGTGEFNEQIFQGTEPTCAIRSQQIILRDFGVDIPQDALKDLALQNNWYIDGVGTPMEAIGNILESQGVGVHQHPNATVYDLVNELAQGRRVIVGVDAGELWSAREGNEDAMSAEAFEDSLGQQNADHALIVAGVEVNPDDPNDVKVILTDPGTGDLRIEYTLDQFLDAWQDSNCYMVATDQPAPYQFDPENNQMVPSNFAIENYIADNTFTLNGDEVVAPTETEYPMNAEEISMPEDYNAYYDEGHLDTIPLNVPEMNWDLSALDLANDSFDLNSLNMPINLQWNDWTTAYDMAYADGSGMFNLNPFITQVVVYFVPVPVNTETTGFEVPPITPPEDVVIDNTTNESEDTTEENDE